MEHSDDELVRERCIRFLHSKVRVLGPQVLTPDVENLIVTESKKVLQVGPFLLIMWSTAGSYESYLQQILCCIT